MILLTLLSQLEDFVIYLALIAILNKTNHQDARIR